MNAMTAIDRTSAEPLGVGDTVADPVKASMIQVGLMKLCGRDIAVPAQSIREVVPRPAVLKPSFSGGSAAVGSVVIRGTVVPVLDIRGWLGFPLDEGGQEVVLVLREEGRLVGLLMNSVSGLARVPVGDIQELSFSDGRAGELMMRSFQHGDALVGLLDTAAVFGRPDVPHAAEQWRPDHRQLSDARRALILLTIADVEIAIDAGRVAATVPNAGIRPAPVQLSDWVGVVDCLGREVPVIDDLEPFGLSGRAGDRGTEPVIVIRLDDQLMVGLKIDRVRRIVQVEQSAICPLPPMLAGRLPVFAGAVADTSGGQSLLIAPEALATSQPLAMLGELSRKKSDVATTPSAPGTRGATATGAPRRPFLVFRAGKRSRACALDSVTQIIPLPDQHTPLTVPGSSLIGLASFNSWPLPLVDLGDGGGSRALDPEQARVVVIQREGAYTGFVVDRLETITRAAAQASPDIGPRTASSIPREFIETLVGGKPEAVSVCDLLSKASGIGPAEAPPSFADKRVA